MAGMVTGYVSVINILEMILVSSLIVAGPPQGCSAAVHDDRVVRGPAERDATR